MDQAAEGQQWRNKLIRLLVVTANSSTQAYIKILDHTGERPGSYPLVGTLHNVPADESAQKVVEFAINNNVLKGLLEGIVSVSPDNLTAKGMNNPGIIAAIESTRLENGITTTGSAAMSPPNTTRGQAERLLSLIQYTSASGKNVLDAVTSELERIKHEAKSARSGTG